MASNSIINNALQPFIELITVDSTNNYAMAALQKGGVAHGTAWFAYNQTAGRGQRGRQWHATPGSGINLSVALNASVLPVSAQFYLLASIAIGTHGFLAKYAGGETCVKWLNDIYWNDRKAGGILIENIIRGDSWQWAVAGIGININQTVFEENAGKAISLRQITGKTFDVLALAKQLHGSVVAAFDRLLNDRDGVLAEYNNILYKKGQIAKLRKDNIVFDAVINNVTADGRLHVESAVGDSFGFGDIDWVIA